MNFCGSFYDAARIYIVYRQMSGCFRNCEGYGRPDGHCLGLFCIYNIFSTIKKGYGTKSRWHNKDRSTLPVFAGRN
jgi:hypothetical protein